MRGAVAGKGVTNAHAGTYGQGDVQLSTERPSQEGLGWYLSELEFLEWSESSQMSQISNSIVPGFTELEATD